MFLSKSVYQRFYVQLVDTWHHPALWCLAECSVFLNMADNNQLVQGLLLDIIYIYIAFCQSITGLFKAALHSLYIFVQFWLLFRM